MFVFDVYFLFCFDLCVSLCVCSRVFELYVWSCILWIIRLFSVVCVVLMILESLSLFDNVTVWLLVCFSVLFFLFFGSFRSLPEHVY